MSHPISELIFWSCDIGVAVISEHSRYQILWYRVLWYRSITYTAGIVISEYTRHQRYCDIGVSLISQHLSYRSSPAVISGYTDITALSCDIGVIRISGFQISYLISKFQNSDIGTYTDVTAPDIRVIQIQLIPAMLYSTTMVQTIGNYKPRKEAAGRRGSRRDTITGTATAVAAQQQAFQSSCNSKLHQKVSNSNEAFIISIARIEMGWRIQSSLAKIEMGWKIQSLAKIEMGWRIQFLAKLEMCWLPKKINTISQLGYLQTLR